MVEEVPRRRRGRVVLAAALLVLAALITLDCLNLIQTEAWVDLSQAPHLNAVSRSKADGSHNSYGADDLVPLATVPSVPVVLFVAFLVLEVAERVVPLRSTRHRFRPRLRAPPALRFIGARH